MIFVVKCMEINDNCITDVSIEGIFKSQSKALDLLETLESYEQAHYKNSNKIISIEEVETDLI